jgi:hypothetical protein
VPPSEVRGRKGRKKTKSEVFSRDPVEATSRLNIPSLTGGSGVQVPCWYGIPSSINFWRTEVLSVLNYNYKSYSSHNACKPWLVMTK